MSVLPMFITACENAHVIIAHNIDFDIGIIKQCLKEKNVELLERFENVLQTKQIFCSMKGTQNIVCAKNEKGWIKYPSLSELYKFCYKIEPELECHDALNDCKILEKCIYRLYYEKSADNSTFSSNIKEGTKLG
tara:strand:- start:4182 stop:4583 length:402 start_codon:yes stop_codon:yes gene_type:complete